MGDLAQKFDLTLNEKEPAASPARPLVNYLWIHATKILTDPDYPTCEVPMAHVRAAALNANLYPEADFHIWLDSKLVDDYSAYCVASYLRGHTQHGNITLRDLQDIPDYAGDPHFVPLQPTDKGYVFDEFNRCGPRNLYSRADYARILVLDHCMQTEPGRTRIIYSDMDCPNVRLREVLPLIEQHGIALNYIGPDRASHGYIGLANDNDAVKAEFETLKSDACDKAHNNALGFFAFKRFVERLIPAKSRYSTVGLRRLLPVIGYEPPPDVSHTPMIDEFRAWKQGTPRS